MPFRSHWRPVLRTRMLQDWSRPTHHHTLSRIASRELTVLIRSWFLQWQHKVCHILAKKRLLDLSVKIVNIYFLFIFIFLGSERVAKSADLIPCSELGTFCAPCCPQHASLLLHCKPGSESGRIGPRAWPDWKIYFSFLSLFRLSTPPSPWFISWEKVKREKAGGKCKYTMNSFIM